MIQSSTLMANVHLHCLHHVFIVCMQ